MTTVEEIQALFPGMANITARLTQEILYDCMTPKTVDEYREDCRKEGDFRTADYLRNWLIERKFRVRDKKLE